MSIDVLAAAKAKAQEAFKQDATPFTNKDRLKLRHIEDDIKQLGRLEEKLKHIEEDIKELKQMLTKVLAMPPDTNKTVKTGTKYYQEDENAWLVWHFNHMPAEGVYAEHQKLANYAERSQAALETHYGKVCGYINFSPVDPTDRTEKARKLQLEEKKQVKWDKNLVGDKLEAFLANDTYEY